MLRYTPTPVQEIHDPILDKAGVRLLIKREDLNHPFVSGNKWWKLKYNLEEAKCQNKKTLLTFGGAYSNHIFATAAAAHEFGFESIGIIRGEETLPLNDTLSFAVGKGMQLHYVTREQYRKKTEPEFIQQLEDKFGDFYLIPEGGTNALAITGCEEFAKTLGNDFDYLCCSVGTGGTFAGLINGLPANKKILGFSSLKGGEFLTEEVNQWLTVSSRNWSIISDYHFGGYGKTTDELRRFIESFYKNSAVPLDPVYTSKLMYGTLDRIAKRSFKVGTSILVLHSGGLQGNPYFRFL
jgi:1-aminocyclopropane-1-carboxylate deaminase